MKSIYGVLLGVSALALAVMTVSCKNDVYESNNNYLLIGNVLNHLELSGLKIEQVQPLVADLVSASAGAAVMIGKQEVGIYKFDTQSAKSREILQRLKNDEYIYVMAMKYPVVVKGSFVFLGVDNHPQKHKLMEAIKTLK
jgi:hypothetical protein